MGVVEYSGVEVVYEVEVPPEVEVVAQEVKSFPLVNMLQLAVGPWPIG